MEAVNNYFTGSVRTVSWGAGTSGSGYGSDSSATGGIQFSSLIKDTKPVKVNDDSGSTAATEVSDRTGSGRQTNSSENRTEKKEALVTDKLTPDKTPDTGNTEDAGEGAEVNAEEMAALLAIMNNLQADRITTAGDGVQLVTEKISTEAVPPRIDTVSLNSAEELVQVSENATSAVNAGGEAEAKKTELETERNGSAETAEKVVENVSSVKYDPEEILKSLEGQGRIVANSTNSPTGTPSLDTNGPTGRDPGEQRNAEEIAKGPVAPTTNEKTETSESSKETDPMEGFTEIPASAPTPFANQTSQAAQTAQAAQPAKTEAGTNETMMMRTSETNMASDLTNLLSSRFPSQNGQLTIELDPENLGKITINVSYDSGHAAVSISATNQKTVEILTQNASAMANIIQQKTGQETQVYIPNAQESSTKQDMASGRESNENAAQQQAKQQEQNSQNTEHSSSAFLQQMRLGLV